MTTVEIIKHGARAGLVAAAVLGLTAGAARADGTPLQIAAGDPSGGDAWQGSLALRASRIRDAGFDPFSTNDALMMASFALTRMLDTHASGFAIAIGVVGDLGTSSAQSRGADAELDVLRGAIVIEPRYLPAPGWFVAGRLAPGLQRVTASLHDSSAPVDLRAVFSTVSADAGVLGGARLTPSTSRWGFWLVAEAGYGWSPSHSLTLKPALGARDADKAGVTPLGTLSIRGPFLRVGVALSY